MGFEVGSTTAPGFVRIATDQPWNCRNGENTSSLLEILIFGCFFFFLTGVDHYGLEEEAGGDNVVCGVNFGSTGAEFSGLPPAHRWIMYILLKKKKVKSLYFLYYI